MQRDTVQLLFSLCGHFPCCMHMHAPTSYGAGRAHTHTCLPTYLLAADMMCHQRHVLCTSCEGSSQLEGLVVCICHTDTFWRVTAAAKPRTWPANMHPLCFEGGVWRGREGRDGWEGGKITRWCLGCGVWCVVGCRHIVLLTGPPHAHCYVNHV